MKHARLILALSACTILSSAVSGQDKKKEKDNCCCQKDTSVACADSNYIIQHPQEILLDFKTKNIAFPRDYYKLRRGQSIRVRVSNYNPFLYNIVINSTDSTVAPLIDANNMLSFLLNPSNLSSIIAGIGPTAPAAAAAALVGTGKKTNKPAAAKTDSAFIADTKVKARLLQTAIDLLRADIEKFFYEQAKTIRLRTALKVDCDNFTIPDEASLQHDVENPFIALRKRVGDLKDRTEEDFDDYLKKSQQYPELAKEDSNVDKRFSKFYTHAGDYLEKLDTIVSYKNLHVLLNSAYAMMGYTPCYLSLPIFFTADVKSVTIQIKPWNDTASLPTYQTSFELPWSQRNVFGISGGVYFTGLHNEGYSVRAGDSTLVKDNGGSAGFGINALAYFATKIHNGDAYKGQLFYGGVAFGGGMSIEAKPKPRIFLGGVLLWGARNRAMITAGVAGGYVEQLSDAADPVHAYPAPPSGYTKDVFKLNGFISINYSFLNQ